MAVLSDRTLREHIAAGRIVLDPFDESCIQPASIDVHLDRYFRVFLNHTMAVIDVKSDLSGLTQEIEVKEEEPFILHPGEFVLGSTRELIGVPDDLVARVEGKSSLGRLGLLIHSSLPASESILIDDGSELAWRTIGDVVTKEVRGHVVSFDPETFRVGFAEITGWYEGPPDRIFEVELASGRSVRVTAGHNLFTLDAHGALRRTRTGELRVGTRVAIPGRVPPPAVDTTVISVARLAAASTEIASVTVDGPTVAMAFENCGSTLRAGLEGHGGLSSLPFLDRLLHEDVLWDEVLAVRDTGRTEPVFDLEVRPAGRKIENFVAGSGGVFVSNTAGFIDAGFTGHITLELSNVANLPITLYPGMKIGQISFLEMTTPADQPYGSGTLGSKYQGQRGPTPSRYWENFAEE